MKPCSFEGHTDVLLAPLETGGVDVASLPVWRDGTQCVSCWRLGWRERLSAILFGRVWVAVLGQTQPPVYAQASRTYFNAGGPLASKRNGVES